jgi:hypothetical protein
MKKRLFIGLIFLALILLAVLPSLSLVATLGWMARS